MKDFMDAWKVSEKQFPHGGTPAEKLAFCVRYAVLAPSVYNTQPWHFSVSGNTVEIYADRRHALPVVDPDDRELTICCAAAIYNLRLAIRHFGYQETTEFTPQAGNDALLAIIRLGEKRERPADEAVESLFKAIPKRHMNRGAYAEKPVGEDILRRLKTAASAEGAWLHVCSEEERKALVRIIAEADHIQVGNKHFRRELASWIDIRRSTSGDGMPNYGLSYQDVMNSLSPSFPRRFAVDNARTATDQEIEQNSPVLAILGSKAGGTIERIHAGQGFMHVLLQAEVDGLSVSTLNQPCEVPELRLALHDAIGQQGRAQMILRMGYGGKPNFTPRRAMEQVLDIEGKTAGGQRSAANDAGKGLFRRVKGLFRK